MDPAPVALTAALGAVTGLCLTLQQRGLLSSRQFGLVVIGAAAGAGLWALGGGHV